MNTKIAELFATLRGLLADQSRDLALAMAELASVAKERDSFKAGRADIAAVLATYAAERDKALTERDAARAGYSAMNRRIYGQGGECFELDKARAERDNARQSLRAAEQEVAEMEADYADLRTVNARLVADLAAAMERLNHAESIIMQ